jgi:hypothetical protein
LESKSDGLRQFSPTARRTPQNTKTTPEPKTQNNRINFIFELHLMYRILSLSLLVCVLLMSSSSSDTKAEALAASSGADEIPRLPPPNPEDSKNLPTIRLGETIRLEEMGPMILNTDGSVRRIDNWDSLSEHEKEVSWRRISKRNEERRQKLLQKQQDEENKAENDEGKEL